MQILSVLLENSTLQAITQSAFCLINNKAEAIKQNAIKLKQNKIKTDSEIIMQPHQNDKVLFQTVITKSFQFALNTEAR